MSISVNSNTSERKSVTFEQCWLLILLTSSYVLGELSHFLIGVTSRDVARTIHYGDSACFENVTTVTVTIGKEDENMNGPTANKSAFLCSSHRNISR
jgi:hypothetical protein